MLKITGNRFRVVVVLDGKKVVGTVSDGDIRRAFLREVLPIAPVEKIMNINCVTTRETDSEKLKDILRREMVTVLPVVNEENELIDVALAYEPFYREERGPKGAGEES
jgi:CBS domain-containing protein